MSELKIYVYRHAKRETYTIGKLYVDGKYFCDTLEDKDRGLDQRMPLEQNKKMKKYGETAIPIGKYSVGIHRWTKYGIDVPILKNVPAFTGILIHNGVNEKNTEGCILVGKNTSVGRLSNGKTYMTRLTDVVKQAIKDGKSVTIEVSDKALQQKTNAVTSLAKKALVAAAISAAFLFGSCKSYKEIEKERIADTVYFTQYKTDSVDRWRTHYEYIKGDTFYISDSFYIDRWHIRTDTTYSYKTITKTETKEVVKERKVYVWKPFAVILAIAIAATTALFIKYRKK